MKKPAPLSAGLVAVKGEAEPFVAELSAARAQGVPLNFRVSADFRRAFRTYAASHDMKQNALLMQCFEAYRQQQGD
jgi:hypothetical protein